MKATYPIILTVHDDNSVSIYIPDFDANTQGEEMTEAIEMARDAIGLMGIDMEDDGKQIPHPSPIKEIKAKDGKIVSLVDVDFMEYRRQNETRAVKKNCTIPGWLSFEAEKAGINFSAVLQNALKKELHISV